MVPTSSNESSAPLSPTLRGELMVVASNAIRAGLGGERLRVRLDDYPLPLQQPRASFVTLHRNGVLRGCIGNLDADRPLVEDVAHNAYAAAFEDPRFPPLMQAEFDGIEIHLSLLTEPVPVQFSSEKDLLAQLRPGIDGLVLEEGRFRGTFLPSVWTQLPEPSEFLLQLKLKAGLPRHYWSDTLRIKRYVVEAVP